MTKLALEAGDLEALKACASAVRAAERPIRVLSTLNWDASVKRDFLAANGESMPQPTYKAFDATEPLALLKTARELLRPGVIGFDWLDSIMTKLEQTAHMLSAIETPDFYQFGKMIWGAPDKVMLDGHTRVIDLAHHMEKALLDLDVSQLYPERDERVLSAEVFADLLRGELAPHFGEQAPRVEVSETLSAKAAAGAKRIRVRAAAVFSPRDVNQLLQHEALIHTATALNGRAQGDFKLLAAAHSGTTETQEGLAVFAEMMSGAMDPARFRRLAYRVIAIQMAADGADFIEVYRYFLSKDVEAGQAYENARRVFRGGVLTGGAPFAKDAVYLNGLLRVHNFMRTVVTLGRADLIRILFCGKMDINDVPAIATLAAQGEITPPKFLPPWVKDLRFLVSYLAYSSFLNRVKLPGFKSYYTEALAHVPDVWDFAATQDMNSGEK